jgi:hypothetical protein
MKKYHILDIIIVIYGICLILLFFGSLFIVEHPTIVYVSINGRTHPDLYVYESWGDYPLVIIIFGILSIPVHLYASMTNNNIADSQVT